MWNNNIVKIKFRHYEKQIRFKLNSWNGNRQLPPNLNLVNEINKNKMQLTYLKILTWIVYETTETTKNI